MPAAPAMMAPQGSAPDQGAPSAAKLVTDINSGLMQLMDLVQKTPSISDQEKQALGEIIQHYQDFVQQLAQGPQAEPDADEAQPGGSVSPEAGANPNARPM